MVQHVFNTAPMKPFSTTISRMIGRPFSTTRVGLKKRFKKGGWLKNGQCVASIYSGSASRLFSTTAQNLPAGRAALLWDRLFSTVFALGQAVQHCLCIGIGRAGLHLHWSRLFSTVFALGQKVQQAVALGQAVQELTQLPILWIIF